MSDYIVFALVMGPVVTVCASVAAYRVGWSRGNRAARQELLDELRKMGAPV